MGISPHSLPPPNKETRGGEDEGMGDVSWIQDFGKVEEGYRKLVNGMWEWNGMIIPLHRNTKRSNFICQLLFSYYKQSCKFCKTKNPPAKIRILWLMVVMSGVFIWPCIWGLCHHQKWRGLWNERGNKKRKPSFGLKIIKIL